MKETNLSDNELLTAIEKPTETLFISEELSFKLNEDMLMGSSLKSKSWSFYRKMYLWG